MGEEDTRREIENLTRRVESMESEFGERSTATLDIVRSSNNFRAKPDVFTDGNWEEWLSHFKLCAEINKWDNEIKCQILAVSLRGRAQSIYLALKDEERNDFKRLVEAMEKMINPERERMAHKLAFRQRKRQKGENLIDLVTDLRKLARRAHPGKDPVFVNEEIVDQFISALDNRELRIGVSQTCPKSMDEALSTALRLESLFSIDKKQYPSTANMAVQGNQDCCFSGEPAEVNSAGSSAVPPAWAQAFLQQQTQLFGKLIEATRSTNANLSSVGNRQRRMNARCYGCGELGHFKRECPKATLQGNGDRAGSRRK